MNTEIAICPHPLDEAEKALGGRAAMARALEVTPGAIGNWKARGVPIKSCVRIARLVPTVTRQRLRPVDFAEIWPDLDCAQVAPAVPVANKSPSLEAA